MGLLDKKNRFTFFCQWCKVAVLFKEESGVDQNDIYYKLTPI